VTFAFIDAEKATDPSLSVTFACRTLGVSTSGFYEWRRAQAQPCERLRRDAELRATIREIHRQSRGTYGAPRVHAELRLGLEVRVGRKRVERLMRQDGLQGVTRRRRRGLTRRDAAAIPNDDLVARQFSPDGPSQLWVADITEHPTDEGRVYCAVVIDAWNRQVVGHSIADHLRAELVVDALEMACWRQRPTPGQTVHHSDHGTQYTSWAFGQRLRSAGLLGSMGTVGDALDNAVAESFFATLQTELLDRHRWTTRRQLAQAIFEWIEVFYNQQCRHSTLGMLAPITYAQQPQTGSAA
jgi:putative transposase